MAPSNELLRSLAPDELESIRPYLEPVQLSVHNILYEIGEPAKWVYFPEAGLLSVLTVMISGEAFSTALIGREAAVGFVEAAGAGVMLSRVIVRLPGAAVRVAAGHYRDAFETTAALRTAMHRATELLLAEARQDIACRALHGIEQRFSRLVSECQDRVDAARRLPLRQVELANMLGVTRPTVSNVASAIQGQRLIRYVRGSIEILDREGLERAACECRASIQGLRRRLDSRDPAGSTAIS
jgi:CRP-like cAMP-binding protein